MGIGGVFDPLGLLAWIGRQRTRAIAALVLFGIALPPVGAVLKPFVTEAVVGLLAIAFMRVDPDAFKSRLRRPGLVLLAAAWTMVAIPVAVLLIGKASGSAPAGFSGGLTTALLLQAAASPMMATPAFAALMGLDATLVLATLIVGSALAPITAPMIAGLAGVQFSLTPVIFGLKLLAVIGGAAALGLVMRRLLGARRLEAACDEIDGLNIIILFIFVSAVMGDLGMAFLTKPWLVAGLMGIAFLAYGGLLGVTYAVFLRSGRDTAFALAMMTAQKNMGLMLAAAGTVLPPVAWLYFAVAQIPIYLSPWLLQPLARRMTRGVGREVE